MGSKYWLNSILQTTAQAVDSTARAFDAIKAATASVIHTYRKQIIAGSIALVFLFTLLAGGELIFTYSHYAAIVDARLNDQSLHQPPGIYAAPRRIGAGQRITQENLVQDLLRAGYLSGQQTSDFAVGNFVVNGHSVEIKTAGFARDDNSPAAVQVSFKKDEVGELREAETGKKLDHIFLPAEMLTADFNSRGQTRRAMSFDEIPQVLINAVCAIEDRRFFSHHGVDIIAIARAALKKSSAREHSRRRFHDYTATHQE